MGITFGITYPPNEPLAASDRDIFDHPCPTG
jgi:hypothetical protein